MIEINEEELLLSLEDGYKKFVSARLKSNKSEAEHIKGWCNAIEGVIFNYAPQMRDAVIKMRNTVVKQPLGLQKQEQDWDTPTYIRKDLKL